MSHFFVERFARISVTKYRNGLDMGRHNAVDRIFGRRQIEYIFA